ncbi:MAG: FtsX-like permease family protein [Bacteroidales bacterium]
MMIKKYLTFAFRNIFRFNTYTLINIFGLAVGLASFILIALFVYDEYSFDKYHTKSNRIYRVTSIIDFNGTGEESSSQPFPLAEHLQKEYPQYIESYVRFFNLQKSQFIVSNDTRVFNERRFFYCDTNVFDLFDFELVKGDKKTVLKKPFSIVITESTARKYFEDTDPIGQLLKVDNYFEFEVSGIVKDTKPQSHFKFDFLASFSSLPIVFKNEKIMQGWIWNPCWTYLLLKNEESAPLLEAELDNFCKKHFNEIPKDSYKLQLQPLTDIHLKSNLDYEIERNENEQYVKILLGIAVLILIMATINFVNLATAGASNRAIEIGIKKVVGAGNAQLILQFFTESLVITFVSLLIAISLVEMFLPAFSEVTGKIITNDFRFKKETLLGLFSLGIFTAIISGAYPAIFLSSLKPVPLLKKNFKLGTQSTKFRKWLVLVQFSISLMLIIGTFGVFRQLKYLHTADLGFKKNNIIIIDAGPELTYKYGKFKELLLKDKNIYNVTAMNYIIGSSHNTYEFMPEGTESSGYSFYPGLFVREDFVKTFNIKIVAGRDFLPNEKDAGQSLLVNEEMVKYLNLSKNEEILGKKFKTMQGFEKVVGVFSNINTTSLHTQVEPFVIKMSKDSLLRIYDSKYIVIQINSDKLRESITSVENVWDKLEVERPFEYKFLQDILDELYKGEDVLGDLARIFTILSIIIASLGIWGLTAYITERRTREIGIRKALGASNLNILNLIGREFLWVALFANLIAWPVAFFILNRWINSFAYRDYISIWSFILASMLGVLIAFLTIGHKAIEAGSKNPIDALKYE